MDVLGRRFSNLTSSVGGGSESLLLLHASLCRIHIKAGIVCALAYELDEGKGREILIDAVFNLFHPPLHFLFGEVPVAVVDCLELTSVDGDERLGEQVKLLA
jgi:hypothetical protein